MSRATLLSLALFAACAGETQTARREAVFRGYVAAVNSHDVSKALAFHTSDPEFVILGQPPIRGRDAMRSLLQWDSVLNSHIRMEPSRWLGDTLILKAGSERNAWFEGIGLDSIRYSAGTRIVYQGDRIKEVHPSDLVPQSAAEFQAKAEAFFRWAQTNAPEVAQLAPGGSFKYDRGSAAVWLQVLQRYGERDAR
ncbi:MAG: nuclear transport factor 2 family protein [Gemmatimonadota bacterium]